MTTYRFGKRMNDGLVGLTHSTHGLQLWSTGRVRGHPKECSGPCGKPIASGADAFRPHTNALNRMDRFCVSCIDAMERAATDAAAKSAPANPGAGSCFHCQRPCTSDDYCFGCRSFVCNECGIGNTIGFGHDPEDHLEAEDGS